MPRTKLISIIAVALSLAAIGVIALLQHDNAENRDAELNLEGAEASLTALQLAPMQADISISGDPRSAQTLISSGKRAITATLDNLRTQGSPPSEFVRVEAPLQRNYAALKAISRLDARVGDEDFPIELVRAASRSEQEASALLEAAGSEYHSRAERSKRTQLIGSAGVIALLLGAFGFYYYRSTRLTCENEEMLATSQREALTDALTGLGNRRALMNNLEAQVPQARPESELLLALFDLDGFKQYNDSFGHPAGDALLARFGVRLAESVEGVGSAYRMGGDEFCLLVEVEKGAHQAVQRAAKALSESGRYFEVTSSYGTAVVPAEATTAEGALQLSDLRMYGKKAARGSASRQTTDVLLKVLDERGEGLFEHVHDVADLADLTGREFGLDEAEIERIHLAAELHDVGKSAIPDAVLNKPGRLDPDEWKFISQHTLIGERIVLAAPALADIAPMIRSAHEWVDGSGYPDGLQGEEIPLGARIVAVCDAYEAMISERPYSAPIESDDALLELERCAGTQFDAEVVSAFVVVVRRASELEALAT